MFMSTLSVFIGATCVWRFAARGGDPEVDVSKPKLA